MRNSVNDNLLERAHYLVEEYTNTTAGKMLTLAIQGGDLDAIREMVVKLEKEEEL